MNLSHRRVVHCLCLLPALALAAFAGQVRGQTPTETAPAAAAPGEETAVGVVFEDRDRDGRRDVGESGIAGVAVSNGLDVVRTDTTGRYRLPVADGTILFVVKPAGYGVAVDADMLPRFHYIHDPDGTPEALGLRYRGVAPSGPLPASVDFPLYRRDEPDDFKVIWFADTQAQTETELDFLREDVIAELIGTDAAFGVTAGDVINDDLSLYPRHNRLIAAIGIPWYNLPGNHDMNYLAPDDATSLETYKRYFGPPYYSFDYGRVHFVMLDDVHYKGRDPSNAVGAGGYEGGLGERQLRWLENDLALVPAGRPVVVAMHQHLRHPGMPRDGATLVRDSAELFRILSTRRQVLNLAGHWQRNHHEYFGAEYGFTGPEPLHHHALAAVSGGWWSGPRDPETGVAIALQGDGTPNGYHVMTVRGTEIALRYKAAGYPADHQMRITIAPFFERPSTGPAAPRKFNDPPIARGRLEAMELVVNLFDGGPKSRVAYRVDDGPEVAMTRSIRRDPLATKLYLQVGDRNLYWTPIDVPSSHIWAAPMPRGLAPGVHRLTVRAVDDYGQEHRGVKLFEVTP